MHTTIRRQAKRKALATSHRQGVASPTIMEFTRDNWYQVTLKSEPRRLRYVGPAMTGWPPDPLEPSGLHIFTDEEGRLVGVAELEVEQAEQEN